MPGDSGVLRVSLTWPQLRSWLLTQREIPGFQTLRKQIRVKLEGFEALAAERFPIFDLLVAEFAVDNQWYVVSDGEVLKVHRTFLERLDDVLKDGLVVVEWNDRSAYENEFISETADDRATEVAVAMLEAGMDHHCPQCARNRLEHLIFLGYLARSSR